MADTVKTVTVEALKVHTYAGKEYQVGDTYDFPEEHADGLAAGGFAVRVDRVKVAKAAKDAEKKPGKPVAAMKLDAKQSRMKRRK